MKKLAVLAIGILSLASSGIAAAGSDGLSVERVMAHTRDGGAWKPGQPVLLMFEVSGPPATFPEKGLGVVMEIDKEKTKCLEVPLRRISEDGGRASYAGVFYPFHEGEFDGKVMFGDSAPQDFTFRVDAAISASTVAGDVPSADPRAAAPPTFAVAARDALPAALVSLLVVLLPLVVRRPRRAIA